MRSRIPRSVISELRPPRWDDGQTFPLLVSADQGNRTQDAMLPAKKHGGGKVMSFPHSALAVLSMFALAGGPGTGEPWWIRPNRRGFRHGHQIVAEGL